jgi:hypothetical protein
MQNRNKKSKQTNKSDITKEQVHKQTIKHLFLPNGISRCKKGQKEQGKEA